MQAKSHGLSLRGSSGYRHGVSSEPEDEFPANRFAVTLTDLEADAHVPAAKQVIEIPGQAPGRSPGDDDLSRSQRDALRAGG